MIIAVAALSLAIHARGAAGQDTNGTAKILRFTSHVISVHACALVFRMLASSDYLGLARARRPAVAEALGRMKTQDHPRDELLLLVRSWTSALRSCWKPSASEAIRVKRWIQSSKHPPALAPGSQFEEIQRTTLLKREMCSPTLGIMRGLGSQFGYANNTRRVCWETPNINLTSVSCEAPRAHRSTPRCV